MRTVNEPPPLPGLMHGRHVPRHRRGAVPTPEDEPLDVTR